MIAVNAFMKNETFPIQITIMGDPDEKQAMVTVAEDGLTYQITLPDGHLVSLERHTADHWAQTAGIPLDSNTLYSIMAEIKKH